MIHREILRSGTEEKLPWVTRWSREFTDSPSNVSFSSCYTSLWSFPFIQPAIDMTNSCSVNDIRLDDDLAPESFSLLRK